MRPFDAMIPPGWLEPPHEELCEHGERIELCEQCGEFKNEEEDYESS